MLSAFFYHLKGAEFRKYACLAIALVVKPPAVVMGIIFLSYDFYKNKRPAPLLRNAAILFSLLTLYYSYHYVLFGNEFAGHAVERAALFRIPLIGQLLAMFGEFVYGSAIAAPILLVFFYSTKKICFSDVLVISYAFFFYFYHHHGYYMLPLVVVN